MSEMLPITNSATYLPVALYQGIMSGCTSAIVSYRVGTSLTLCSFLPDYPSRLDLLN
jgi:hypothetical protein